MSDARFIRALRWDDWNLDHITKHGMAPDDVADVIRGRPMVDETYKERLRLIGPNHSGRILTIIVGQVPNEPGVYYTFSARPASRKERRLFLRQEGDQKR